MVARRDREGISAGRWLRGQERIWPAVDRWMWLIEAQDMNADCGLDRWLAPVITWLKDCAAVILIVDRPQCMLY